MLKKSTLFTSMLLATSTALATPFNGFYAGADIGMSQATFKQKQALNLNVFIETTPIIGIDPSINKKMTDTSFLGNFDIGYTRVLGQYLFVGLEFSADWQNLNAQQVSALQELDSGFGISYNTAVDLKNELALTFNPGIVFNKTTLLYGKVGPAWGRFDVSGNAQYSQSLGGPTVNANAAFDQDSFYECGLRLGLGIEQYVSEHLSLKLELLNTNYGTIHSGSPVVGAVTSPSPFAEGVNGQLSNSDKIKASNSSILFGFNYHFG